MRKLVVCLLGFILLNVFPKADAQNTFVYLRYDLIPNDISRIQLLLDSLKANTEGKFVLFFENNSYEDEEYDELTSDKGFLRYTSLYEPEIEKQKFSEACERLLDETVTICRLTGSKDYEWKYVFVLSDESVRQELFRLISTNSLSERVKRLQFLIYDNRSNVTKMTYRESIDNNNLTIFNF